MSFGPSDSTHDLGLSTSRLNRTATYPYIEDKLTNNMVERLDINHLVVVAQLRRRQDGELRFTRARLASWKI